MDPFVAEIRIFPFTFPPRGWAWCDGQSLPTSQNTALFSLLGVTYGGNGTTNFNLPNLQGRAAMLPNPTPNPGHRPPAPLQQHDLGETGGVETVTLQTSQIPSHTHGLMATVEDGRQGTLVAGVTLAGSTGGLLYQTNTSANLVPMNGSALTQAGNSQPHNNMMPYLTFYFNIALQGVFPQRQ